MSHIPSNQLQDPIVEILTFTKPSLTFQGPLDEIIDIEINDPLVAKYSFDDAANPAVNEHNPGVYDGALTGTTTAPGVASDAKTLLSIQNGVDASAFSSVLTPVGTGSVSGGTVTFDGIANYVGVPFPNFNLNLDFIIEMKLTLNSPSGNINFLDQWNGGGDSLWQFRSVSATSLVLYYYNAGAQAVTFSWHPADGVESHIVVKRKGNLAYLFADGVLRDSQSIGVYAPLSNPVSDLMIGSSAVGYSGTGQIKDLRIISASDEYEIIGRTSLLLHSDKANASTDMSDLDVSVFGETITSSSLIHSTAQTLPGHNSSLYFNGTAWAQANAPSIGTKDFHVSMKFMSTAASGFAPLFSTRSNGGTTNGMVIAQRANEELQAFIGNGSGWVFASAVPIAIIELNVFNELSVDKKGDLMTIRVNGITELEVSIASAIISTDFLTVGAELDHTNWFTGYIQDVHYVVGGVVHEADYTVGTAIPTLVKDFTPPTTLPAVYESLLGLGRDFAAGDHVDLGTGNELMFPISDFSYAAWVKTTGGPDGWQTLLGNGEMISPGAADWGYNFVLLGGQLAFALYDTDSTFLNSSTTKIGPDIEDGKWHHVAITLEHATEVKSYVDGNLLQTYPISTFNDLTSTNPLWIGNINNRPSQFVGSMDDVRIYNRVITLDEVKALFKPGVRYIKEANPASADYGETLTLVPDEVSTFPNYTIDTEIAPGGEGSGPYDSGANTSLLIHFDNATFVDASGTTKTITTVGAPTMDGADMVHGAGSGVFSNGNYIKTPDHADLDLAGGSFTIDFKVKLNNNGLYSTVWSQENTGVSGDVLIFQWRIDNNWRFQYWDGAAQAILIDWPATVVNGTWYHLKMIFDGVNIALYSDDTLLGSSAWTNVWPSAVNSDFFIGARADNPAQHFLDGKLDEFRITKGLALDFTSLPYLPLGPGIGGKLELAAPATDPTQTTDKDAGNTALAFNGSNQVLPLSNPFAAGNTYTVNMWVKLDNITSGTLMGNRVGTLGIEARFGGLNLLYTYNASGNAYTYGYDTTFVVGQWHMVTFIYPCAIGGFLRMLIDGVEPPTSLAVGTGDVLTAPTNNFLIGTRPDLYSYMNGAMQDFQIFRAELTDEEIGNLLTLGQAKREGTLFLQDQIGNSHGSVVGAVDKAMQHTSFDGASQYLIDVVDMPVSGSHTIAFELYLNNTANSRPMGSYAGVGFDCLQVDVYSGAWRFLGAVNGTLINQPGGAVTSGVWLKMLMIVDNDALNAKLYIDGVLKATAPTFSTAFTTHGYNFGIGGAAAAGGNSYMNGLTRNIEMYSGYPSNPTAWVPSDTSSLAGVTNVLVLPNGSPE